jgi:hypothetical protein
MYPTGAPAVAKAGMHDRLLVVFQAQALLQCLACVPAISCLSVLLGNS